MPLYGEDGELHKGEYNLPLFKPPIEVDTLRGLLGQPNQYEYLYKLMDEKKTPVKYLEWSSIVVRLNEFKNKVNFPYFSLIKLEF